jgi:mannose-6-phosphate isomerase-like protein (cupin superfamily)
MIKHLLTFSVMLIPPQAADNPAGFLDWPKGIPPGNLAEKDAFGNHTLSISHRDKDGLAEVHEKFVDVIIVQTGEATLVVGGKVIEPSATEPGEIRGKAIAGGTKRSVSPGDVIHIAAGTPHQFFIAAGSQITYVLVKIAVP